MEGVSYRTTVLRLTYFLREASELSGLHRERITDYAEAAKSDGFHLETAPLL